MLSCGSYREILDCIMKNTCTHDLQYHLQFYHLFLTNKIKLVNNVINIIKIKIYDLKIKVHVAVCEGNCVLHNVTNWIL